MKVNWSQRGRAWVEIDRQALRNNAEVLRGLVPEGCELMPAVKAEGYGHGGALIARELMRLGVRSFCVASAGEGVSLRKAGVRGEILVLGYTDRSDLYLLRRYRLTQTVLDYSYALALRDYGRKLRVHIAMDTGMHRLGERFENNKELYKIFQMKNLKITGMFTHLCAADTDSPGDREFTMNQVRNFHNTVELLKSRGVECPKLHMLSSYGILNYPQYAEAYVRPGIALYGVLGTKADTEKCPIPLRPVLTLKARIASLKTLKPGEFSGYGLKFKAERETQIAVLSIGYADGLPRVLSCGKGCVLINGYRAPIIGAICMDQTTVDVTGIPGVCQGGDAVIIGRSGSEEISAADLAEQAGTITNEILSRLGGRLGRVLV